MQKVKIPVTLDPVRSAQKRLSFDGYITLDQMPRLAELLLDDGGRAEVTLECGIDEQEIVFLQGKAAGLFQVTCQRCSEPMALNLAAEFNVTPVEPDCEQSELSGHYEPVSLDEEGTINLHELIEDELILALPQVPRHDVTACGVSPEDMSYGELGDQAERPNPFAILEQLKRK